MLIELEKRKEPSRAMVYLTPVIAVRPDHAGRRAGLLAPRLRRPGARSGKSSSRRCVDPGKWQDLGVKAAPLIMIAVGLSIGFRANVWNIGAEGQYVIGGLAGTGVALATWHLDGLVDPAADVHRRRARRHGLGRDPGVPARRGCNVNEILSSLMLTYVAIQLLYYLMNGPWKDPEGFNFPQTRLFNDSQIAALLQRASATSNVPLALVDRARRLVRDGARPIFGFQVRVVGAAPQAARYGGFSRDRTIWLALLVGGGLAGLAGIFEAAGPVRPDGAAVPDRLRLHRDHRRLPRPAAPDGHRHPRRHRARRHLRRRRDARRPRSACRARRPASSRR